MRCFFRYIQWASLSLNLKQGPGCRGARSCDDHLFLMGAIEREWGTGEKGTGKGEQGTRNEGIFKMGLLKWGM